MIARSTVTTGQMMALKKCRYLFHLVDESLRNLSGELVEVGDLLQVADGAVLVIRSQAMIASWKQDIEAVSGT